jgi:hypothetical protein
MMMDLIAFFGKKQCLIKYSDEIMSCAFRHDKFYLLSLKDFINVISSENDVNVSSSKNRHKRIDDVSSKLWHHHLSNILRGGLNI